jgi:nucleoside-diphosphate-sugar epimerase
MRSALGWEPTVRLEHGLASAYAWIKEQLERRVQQPVAGAP